METATVPAITTEDDITEDFPHIKANQCLFLQLPSGNVKQINLKPDTKISLGKFGTFKANALIGQPFGLTYQIINNQGDIKPARNMALEDIEETEANNRDIFDTKDAQKLTFEEIEKMKQDISEGADNESELIQKMIQSHASFDKKTEFSKAKYVQRKKKKFSKQFTPTRPTLYSVAEYFFERNPEKIGYMRVDTLSQVLNMANIHAEAKYLVVDDTQGLILSAVAERMGGYGKILGIHDGLNHNYDVLRYHNFSKRTLDSISTLPWTMVDKNEPTSEGYTEKSTEEVEALNEREKINYERRKKTVDRIQSARDILFEGGFDGLVIASQYSPMSILENLLPYISGSRPIVIYSAYKEFLVEAFNQMKLSNNYLNVQLTESWLREYQVLPGRTHPEMTTSGGGGYVLSAIRVLDEPKEVPEDGPEAKKIKTDNE
ncbi:tRNA (adenine(58)-N(1))-methyltransferase non-catalytic subunit trm6 [Umbelopsis sp. WA50703]